VTGCAAHTGSYSAGAIVGGSGYTGSCTQNYPNNLQTTMYRNGCDSVSGAPVATLAAWVMLNAGSDKIGFMFPTSYGALSWTGPALTGNWPGVWANYSWDLTAFPYIGDLTTRPCVQLAVSFQTDGATNYQYGARVDDIGIAVSTGGGVGGGGGGGGGSGACTPNGTTLCLFSNRFQVTAQYDTYGSPGTFLTATATPFSDTTGFFTTVTAGDVDVVVKLVNFCSQNNTWSAYLGGTTDLGVNIVVTDTSNARVYNASNAHGSAWNLIRQVAFSCP
jgi:hypothetical protein